jgi:RNA polymerase-binding transcription factor DksA
MKRIESAKCANNPAERGMASPSAVAADRLLRERDERRTAHGAARDETAGDPADAAENDIDHCELLAELAVEDHELRAIEAALTRIRIGNSGVCEVTGKPISRALPWARTTRCAADVGWHSTLHS